MMWSFFLFIFLLSAASCIEENIDSLSHSKKMIEHINSLKGIHWKAAPSKRFQSVDEMKVQLGALLKPTQKLKDIPTLRSMKKDISLPKFFDAREKWPQCTIIRHIPDQSSCGSCWAVSSASVMSDRLCIHRKTHDNVHVSARDLIASCYKCGRGCSGGWMWEAFRFWNQSGIVTGGSHGCKTGCQPYPFPKCGLWGSYPPCFRYGYRTPDSLFGCKYGYENSYEKDKTYGVSYYILPKNETVIMEEIITNGPVTAAYLVFEDFRYYDSGIYERTSDVVTGAHAVRIIGWGEEEGKKYWLIANSWNEQWGEEGYFRMIRGRNECGIEEYVVAGIPKV